MSCMCVRGRVCVYVCVCVCVCVFMCVCMCECLGVVTCVYRQDAHHTPAHKPAHVDMSNVKCATHVCLALIGDAVFGKAKR